MVEERALVVCLWSGTGVPGDDWRANVSSLVTSTVDQTGVPGGSVTYSVMVYGTTAELDLIEALNEAVIEWREPWPPPDVVAVVAGGPDDLPDAATFGQFIASLVPFLYPTGVAAQAIFGANPSGRNWEQIGEDGIANQRIAGGV